MKRNSKPFSVEIKKSRVQGERNQVPPKRLVEPMSAEGTKLFRKEEPRTIIEPGAARRILPSILEPVWSNSEPLEPVHRRRSPKVKANRGQIEVDLDATAFADVIDSTAETLVIAEAVSRTDIAPSLEENAMPVHEVQHAGIASAKAMPPELRHRTPKAVEQRVGSEPMSEPEHRSQAEAIEPLPVMASQKAGHHRLTKRQAAAIQLPRNERWKRRLHPAAW
jgi:hypothetical protein